MQAVLNLKDLFIVPFVSVDSTECFNILEKNNKIGNGIVKMGRSCQCKCTCTCQCECRCTTLV